MLLEDLPQLFIGDVDVLLQDGALGLWGVFGRLLGKNANGRQQCGDAQKADHAPNSRSEIHCLVLAEKEEQLLGTPPRNSSEVIYMI